MSRKSKLLTALLAALAIMAVLALPFLRDGIPYFSRLSERKTVADRIPETKKAFEEELAPKLIAAGVSTKPAFVTLLFLKDKKTLTLFAGDSRGRLRPVKTYDVKAASGRSGPKLREGDRQVPEGIYRVEALNPNSAYYLSLRVNYPNETDRKFGQLEKRASLGGDIMIHGSRVSIGCLAVGDEAIAEIFHLAATAGYGNWKLLFAPTDLRETPAPAEVLAASPWMKSVYSELREELLKLPAHL